MMMRNFACKYMGHPRGTPLTPKTKSFLYRCKQLATGAGREKLAGYDRTPAVELEYALWNWYVDMMQATTSRIWPVTLRNAADTICAKLRKIHADLGKDAPSLPTINPQWIWRFVKKHHIVWRASTVKYKVSRSKLLRRSKRTWLQSNKVRHALELLHGQERAAKRLKTHCHILDQKPFHLNEQESTGQGTLSWQGMPNVPLKSNVAASRSRMSFNNMASDDPLFQAPLEVCFKLGTNRCLKALRLPGGLAASLRHSASGSYDEDTFMAYLTQWIPVWSDERAADKDYRILFLDGYRVHNMECVKLLLWERGFFRIRNSRQPVAPHPTYTRKGISYDDTHI